MNEIKVGLKMEYSIPSTFAGEKYADALEKRYADAGADVRKRINTQRIVVTVNTGGFVVNTDGTVKFEIKCEEETE